MVFKQINDWLLQEKLLGSKSPERMVLATAGADNIPHSRIVAIREINEKGILFFTQKGTRKTIDIKQNPHASMTLWLPLQQRQVVLEGQIETLTSAENSFYWQTRTKDRQLHFMAYSPTSGKPITNTDFLQSRLTELEHAYAAKDVPLSEYYVGYRLVPMSCLFYTLIDEGFSEVKKYTFSINEWKMQVLSP